MDLNQFQHKGMTYLHKCSEQQLVETISLLENNYHNGGVDGDNTRQVLTDTEYDMIRSYAQQK